MRYILTDGKIYFTIIVYINTINDTNIHKTTMQMR